MSGHLEIEKPANKVPVTILTGHLGAGKTTLLRRILRNNLGLRIAVIENEFGDEVGIERLLANTSLDMNGEEMSEGNDVFVKSQTDLFVELSNGCVCCSVKDTLVNTLETLLSKNRNRFDHIVIETTGLADPGPLAGIFWLDDELESELVLDGVVTVVDLANIDERLDDNRANEARLQIAYADRIVLNKRELVSWDSFEQTLKRIQTLNPLAQLEAASFGRVDIGFCLSIGAYDASRLKLRVDVGDVDHDPAISSVVLRRTDKPINLMKLRDWIAGFLWEPPEGVEIFRIKGLVWGDDNPSMVRIIQGVHKLFDITDLDVSWAEATEEGKAVTTIVVIGRINPSALRAVFDKL